MKKTVLTFAFAVMAFTSLTSVSSFAGLGKCAGTAAPCDQVPVGECTKQTGCHANADGKACTGISLGCVFMTSEQSCKEQKGCTFAP